ncbi:hypothetical protein [Devosia sp.]|uniref:hypothetical protein n=1 Tax=Devosia sp. TaxID=1871048 RepID=UPI0035AF7104
MLNPAHLLEVALLLLATFLVGAVLGTLLRLLALRFQRPVAVKPAPVSESAAAEDPFPLTALVAAPVIEPLPQPARPVEPVPLRPEDVPIPDFAAALQELVKDSTPEAPRAAPVAELPAAEPLPPVMPSPPVPPRPPVAVDWTEIRPARAPGEATSGGSVGPLQAPAPETVPPAAVAEVIPFPFAAAPARPVAPSRPADPEIAWEAVPVLEPAAVAPRAAAEPDAFIEMPTAALVAELAAIVESSRKPALPGPQAPATPLTEAADVPPAPAIALSSPILAAADQAGTPPAAPAASAEVPVPQPAVPLAVDAAPVLPARDPAPLVEPVAAQPVPLEPNSFVPPPAPVEVTPIEPAPAVADPIASPSVIEARPVEIADPIDATPPVDATLPSAGVASAPDPDAPAEHGLSAARQPAPPPASLAAAPLPADDGDESDEDREAAAMRAIEGSWTPGRVAARPARRLDPPEGVSAAVSASGAAIAAAARAVEAVVAEASAPASADDEIDLEIDLVAALNAALAPEVPDAPEAAAPPPEPGRPVGLDVPRHGTKDDLTHVIGILPAIELQLNQLGIYHFDQLAGLDEANIAWLEAQLATPGRIRRELWREQARELEAALRPRAATGS